MSEDTTHDQEIVHSPENYFHTKGKELQARIEEVELDPDEEERLRNQKAVRILRDEVLGMFKVGSLVNTLLNWNSNVEKEVEEAKRNILMNSYIEKTEAIGETVSDISDFLSDPHGNTLFNKALSILEDSPPDEELMDKLASALTHITNSDFHKLFEKHKYALEQIETLTPQALTILSDVDGWPEFKPGTYSATGGKITSDWVNQFAKAYAESKRINNHNKIERIKHSIRQLRMNDYLEARTKRSSDFATVQLSNSGEDIQEYLSH